MLKTELRTNKMIKIKKFSPHGFKSNWLLYVLLLPAIIQVFIFAYVPLPGFIISFMDYDYFQGFSSPFVGFKNFVDILTLPDFTRAIINTLTISISFLFIVFPIPIIFTLMLNELKNGLFKRFLQSISYMPHFLSWIAVIGIAVNIYSSYGMINDFRVALFGANTERILFLTIPGLFVPNVLILTIWKEMGWSSIIYLASITGIDPSLYEAASLDGAGKLSQAIHITLPSIMPTIVILFILQIGHLFSSNFDLIYGLQNAFVDFEVISTVIYKYGITKGNYDIATAMGFMQGIISLLLVLTGNWLSRKVNNISII